MANWDVTTAADRLEFETVDISSGWVVPVDANHFIAFWEGDGFDGFVQVFEVNTTTWAVTTAAARLEFDTDIGRHNSCYQIDTNHFINFWVGSGFDGFVQVFEVNTTTWAVTTAAARLEFDTADGGGNSCYQIDTNHFINFWVGPDRDLYVQIFEVNTTTWAVTTAAASLEFDTVGDISIGSQSCYQIDSNHFINFWVGPGTDGFVQVFEVNTTTWAVTTASDRLEYDTAYGANPSCQQIDSNHFINFWTDIGGTLGTGGYTQVFEVNTTTWAVTTAASVFVFFATSYANYNASAKIDTNHFINFFVKGSGANGGGVQVVEVNTTTWAVTTASDLFTFETVNSVINFCCRIDTSHFLNFWKGVDSDGFVQVFEVEVPSSGNNYTDDLVDSVGLTDTISKQSASTRPIVDSLGLTDTISLTNTIVRSLQDNIGLADSLGDGDTITRSLTDSIGLSDSLSISRSLAISLSDSIGVTGSVLSSQSHVVNLTDSLGITDSLTTISQSTRSLADALGLIDTLNAVNAISRGLIDNIGLTDIVTSQATTPEDTNYTYIQHAYFGAMYYGSYTSMLQLAPSSLEDSVGITDTIQTQTTYVVSLSDSVGVTDTITESSVTIRELQDDEGITDTNNVGILHVRSLVDGVGITDEVIPTIDYLISLVDSVGITDDVDVTKATVVSLQDDMGITDEGAVIGLLLTRELQDNIGLIDNIISTLIYKKRSIVSGEIDNFKISLSSVDNIPVKIGSISDIKLKLAEIEDK